MLNELIGQLDANEKDPGVLWAEIHRLRSALKGPDGYATWQEAATAERLRRVKAESRIDIGRYAGTYGGTVEAMPPRTLWKRFQDWCEHTGFMMNGRDGGM